jgi:hypothetical protein
MKKLVGGILFGVGVLVAGASGTCSLLFLDVAYRTNDPQMLRLVVLTGGALAIGLMLLFAGIALFRANNSE